MIYPSENIDKVVDWYGNLKKDYRDIEALIYAQKQLSVALYQYAAELGSLYETAKGAEYARKAAFERERLRLVGEGKSAAAAENEAKEAVNSLLFNETQADAEYKAAYFRQSAAGDILRVMQQHIASLKDERRFEMTTT